MALKTTAKVKNSDSKNSNKLQTLLNNTKTKKPPAVDKLLIPAIVLALSILLYQFFRGITTEIKRVNLEDEIEVREVFFGEDGTGKNYVVLCHEEDSKIPISSVFAEAHKNGKAPAEFRIMDCNYILPESGKSIIERFKFDNSQRPIIFVSGDKINGEPQQIPAKHLKTGSMLIKVLKNKFEPRSLKIETTQDLRTKCLDKDICALLLKGSKKAPNYLKDAMSKLLIEFPKVTFAAIDSTVLYAYNLEEYLPELENEQPRFVVLKKLSGSLNDPKSGRLITSIAPLSTSGVSYGQMSNLIASVVQNNIAMEKIPALPTIKTRTKKLEQDERAKRQRKFNRQNTDNHIPDAEHQKRGSSSQENDGSRDGRRSERQRRRQEHNKQHNVKPKTPEEIAEIERQRRIRMEEEAIKWNVAPEDLPPDGDKVYIDEDEENLDDLNEETVVHDVDHDDNDDEEGEDVIDLD